MTGPAADLATLREFLTAVEPTGNVELIYTSALPRVVPVRAALARVEAELSRLREQRDALDDSLRDAGQIATMMRDRAEAAEARCARLQQALREIAEIDERDDSRPIFFGLQNAFFKAQRIAREALEEGVRSRRRPGGSMSAALPQTDREEWERFDRWQRLRDTLEEVDFVGAEGFAADMVAAAQAEASRLREQRARCARLQQALRLASDYCARPSGVCFDPALAGPSEPDKPADSQPEETT